MHRHAVPLWLPRGSGVVMAATVRCGHEDLRQLARLCNRSTILNPDDR
jgi:hypothetical protein